VTAAAALSQIEVDALREVTNVGAGHAATALAKITNVPVTIDVPRVSIGPLATVVSRFAGQGDRIAALSMEIQGDLSGRTVLLMREDEATFLCERLLQREAGSGTTLAGELERSCLQETGNILASSFLNALADWVGKRVLPSVPVLAIDDGARVASDAAITGGEDPVLVVETSLIYAGADLTPERLSGLFLYLLDRPSLDVVLGVLGVS